MNPRAAESGLRELVAGQRELIPFFAKSAKLTFQTINARSEELSAMARFRDPWRRGQLMERASAMHL